MKLYLGGGWNPEGGEEALEKAHSCVEQIFRKEGTKQVLHIPFARTGIMKKNRNSFGPEKFGSYIESLGITYLNAIYFEDIEAFRGDTIYINGGNDCEFLLQMCKNEKLMNAILRSRVIIGESCGSMIMGEYFLNNTRDKYIKGLGYVKNTIIEPHFTQKTKEERLKNGMDINNVRTGLGIDEDTFIEYENGEYGGIIGFGGVIHL